MSSFNMFFQIVKSNDGISSKPGREPERSGYDSRLASCHPRTQVIFPAGDATNSQSSQKSDEYENTIHDKVTTKKAITSPARGH